MRYRLILILVALVGRAGLFAADYDAAAATNQLGLDLYRQLSRENPEANLILSPYSISSALALAYTGSAGATRTEMARVLHFPADDLVLQTSLNRLRSDLDQIAASTVEPAEQMKAALKGINRDGDPDRIIEWHLANRLFGERTYAFNPAFLARMKDGYGAALEPLDFRHDAPAARLAINQWVEAQTHGKIRDLIPAGGVDGSTRLALVNALYLKAPWMRGFDPRATRPAPFHISKYNTPSVPTMCQELAFGYRHEDGVTTLVLPYIHPDLQFVIFLPDQRTALETVVARLTPEHLKAAGHLSPNSDYNIRLYLPKFRLPAPTMPLGRALQALGMRSAFDQPPGRADFSGIAIPRPNDYLRISEVFHQTFLSVDEKGAEAAAATIVGPMSLGIPPEPIEVRVDRPFLFAIQHRPTGLCLFLGRVTDPR